MPKTCYGRADHRKPSFLPILVGAGVSTDEEGPSPVLNQVNVQ